MYTNLIDVIKKTVFILQFLLPVLCVCRWNLKGVVLGTIIVEVGVILLDSMALIDPRVTWCYECYETWPVMWIPGLIYCLLLLGLKWGLKFGAKLIFKIELDWLELKSRK